MNNLEKFQLITEHKDNVIRNGKKIVIHELKLGNEEFARKLADNIYNHDYTKFLRDLEWIALCDKEHPDFQKAVENHRIRNLHHPECWHGGIHHMEDLWLCEMTIDWCSRSTEMGKDIIHWIDTVACPRFKFAKDGETYQKIMGWVKIIFDNQF